MHFQHVENDHNPQSEQEVHQRKSLRCARNHVQTEDYQEGEVTQLELVIFFSQFNRPRIILGHLLSSHLFGLNVEGHLTRFLFLFLLQHHSLGFSFLRFLSLLVFLILFFAEWIDSLFDEIDDVDNAEDQHYEEGEEDSAPLAVLGH